MNATEKEISVYTAVFEMAKEGKDLRELRVQEIADAAGMGKGTLYEYFKSKDEIIQNTVVYFLNLELAEIQQMLNEEEEFEHKLHRIFEGMIQKTHCYSSFEVLFANAEKLGTRHFLQNSCDQMQKMIPVLTQLLDILLELGQKQQVIQDIMDKDYQRFVILSGICAFHMCIYSSKDPQHDPQVEKAIDYALLMIKKGLN